MEAHSLPSAGRAITVPRSRRLLGALGDEPLVAQLRRGNEVAFEVLYDRHHSGVLSYCRHMLGSRDEAEDAVQQSFVSAHSALMASDKPISFKAWIYTIARNRCLSMLRARREQPSDDLEAVETVGLAEQVEQRADLKGLLADLRELPEQQRAALVLSEIGDLSHAEIALVVGCEVPKVKSLVFQARSGLIERRQGRETPCDEIREQLSTLRGGALRRGPLRRHLKECPACMQFREEVKRQRQMMAVVLPVIPTLGLKESALAAIGGGSAGGGALAAGGLGAALIAKAGAAKVAIVALAAAGAVAGGAAIEQGVSDDPSPSSPVADTQTAGAGSAGAGPAVETASTTNGQDGGGAGALPGNEAADEDEQTARVEQSGAAGGRRSEAGTENGFTPTESQSSGEEARKFALTRGNGRKTGLTRTQQQRASKRQAARKKAETKRERAARKPNAGERRRAPKKAKPPSSTGKPPSTGGSGTTGPATDEPKPKPKPQTTQTNDAKPKPVLPPDRQIMRDTKPKPDDDADG